MFPGIDRKQAAAESLRNYPQSWIKGLIRKLLIKGNPFNSDRMGMLLFPCKQWYVNAINIYKYKRAIIMGFYCQKKISRCFTVL